MSFIKNVKEEFKKGWKAGEKNLAEREQRKEEKRQLKLQKYEVKLAKEKQKAEVLRAKSDYLTAKERNAKLNKENRAKAFAPITRSISNFKSGVKKAKTSSRRLLRQSKSSNEIHNEAWSNPFGTAQEREQRKKKKDDVWSNPFGK